MLKKYEARLWPKSSEIKVLVVAGIILFAVGVRYLLSIESISKQSLSPQQYAPVTVNTSLDSLSSKQDSLPNILQVAHFAPVFIWQVTSSASPQVPTFEKTISNPAVVQKVYKAIIALPQRQNNLTSCTFNPKSVTNELRFFDGNKLILHATVVVGSCFRFVRIDESDLRDTDSAFLPLLTKSLRVTEHELYGLGEE